MRRGSGSSLAVARPVRRKDPIPTARKSRHTMGLAQVVDCRLLFEQASAKKRLDRPLTSEPARPFAVEPPGSRARHSKQPDPLLVSLSLRYQNPLSVYGKNRRKPIRPTTQQHERSRIDFDHPD